MTHSNSAASVSLRSGADRPGCSSSSPSVPAALPRTCHCGDHAFVDIGGGLNTLVSVCDISFLDKKWRHSKGRGNYIGVIRNETVAPGTRRTLILSREILAAPQGFYADHANGDPLDNRRGNIRLSTPAQNAANSKKRVTNTCGFKGVSLLRGRFRARIAVNGKRTELGGFDTAAEAYAAYVDAAKRLHGEFARFE